MAKKGKRGPSRLSQFLEADLGRYDPTVFHEDWLYRDKIVSVLGAPMDGWVPELVYRLAIDQRTGLNVDWAIMTYAFREETGATGDRRRVERIDICESEVHLHRFRRSDDPADDQGERRRIISLYAGDEATVSHQWDEQMMAHSREWEYRMRRWIDG